MLHDVVLHLNNEQPLMADLLREPGPQDILLLCTNLRYMNGKRPVFVDDGQSTFVFPMSIIRFVEIKPGTVGHAQPRVTVSAVEPTSEMVAEAAPEPETGRVSPARRLHPGPKDPAPKVEATAPALIEVDYPTPPLDRLAWISGETAEPPADPVRKPEPAPAPEPVVESTGEPSGNGEELIWRIREV